MTTETKTQLRSAVAPLYAPEKIAEVIKFNYTSDSKKSARLELTQHKGWDRLRDFVAKDIYETYAAIAALTKVAEGMIWGNDAFIVTAPPENYVAKYGRGTYGWLSHRFDMNKDMFSFEFDGEEVVVPITADMIPTKKGWVRLTLDCGDLFVAEDEPIRDRNFKNGWSYHYCQTLSAIVDGANISIGLGPKTIPDGLKVMELIVNAEDPVAGVGTFRFSQREFGRAADNLDVHAADLNIAQEAGEVFASDSPELIVPLAQGGEISLATWNHLKKVPIVSALGLPLGELPIADDSVASRIAVARTINECGYLVKL